jgi:valyl-tRNA synthetase
MGWDDNGLPTERRVQNFYGVLCDPSLPYDPGFVAPTEPCEPPRHVSRRNFTELCHGLTAEDELVFEDLWRKLGLSVDWSRTYATIDDRSQRVAQRAFLRNLARGEAYRAEAPVLWDVDYRTAVAQAELEDREKPGAYHRISFWRPDGAPLHIETTRPELVPACVALVAHPDDERYRPLFGTTVRTPLFGVDVEVKPHELADPEKGSGIAMICTFGDVTDVVWWRELDLPTRSVMGADGRLLEEPPEAIARAGSAATYAELAGKTANQARRRIVELLTESGDLDGEPRPITHPVKYYEKGERPLEIITSGQWYLRNGGRDTDLREQLLHRGKELHWHPPHMQVRYENWVNGLTGDWLISRQRFFGVAFPVWYPVGDDGEVDYDHPIPADEDRLPIDPTSAAPAGFDESRRGRPGGFVADPDVMDTWATSSLTPQIATGWEEDPDLFARTFPMDLRPQAHEIIRTWLFSTVVRGHLENDTLPWRNATISGWVLDPDRKKMSKSKGNVMTPLPLIDKYTADGVRYWAASARLGVDTALDEKVCKVGKRLVTKFFNAGKFVLSQTGEVHPIHCELDRGFAAKLRGLVERVTPAFERFNHAQVLQEVESFFWSHFTDTYLELVKLRARDDAADPAARGSALAALHLGLNVLLRLHAPFLPYITEEVWSWVFAGETGHASIHRAPWPGPLDFAAVPAPDDAGSFDAALACLAAVNKAKSDASVSMGREVLRLGVAANAGTRATLERVLSDVLGAARCGAATLLEDDALEDGAFEVREAVFAKN